MDVKFAPSFFESLKKLRRHNTWWYKTYSFFRYDLIRGIKNIFFFWRVIWNFRSWDSNFQMKILARSLEPLAHTLEHYGNEVEVPRMKKVAKIKRAIEILNNHTEDNYIELAEKELGYEIDMTYGFLGTKDGEEEPQEIQDANERIYSLADEKKDNEWDELWRIFRGQEYSAYQMLMDRMTKEERRKKDYWSLWFDGTDMRGWWD